MYSGYSDLRCCICQHQITVPRSVIPPLKGKIICHNCNEDAKSVINFATKLEDVGSGTNRPFVKVISWIVKMEGKESDLNKKIIFMRESLLAIKDRIQSYVELKPGCNGASIPAQRALLAAKSEIFKNILDSDDVNAQSDTVTLAELNAEELESLVEFLYLGCLPEEKLERHASALFAAAHKYEISYLEEACASHLQTSLSEENAFDFLELSDAYSHMTLKDASVSYILQNMEDFVFSDKYESFMLKNPTLCMEITRKFVSEKKKERRNMDQQTFVQKRDQISTRNMIEQPQNAQLIGLALGGQRNITRPPPPPPPPPFQMLLNNTQEHNREYM